MLKKVLEVEWVKKTRRYSKTNNKYMKSYENDKASVYMIYFEANKFHGSTIIKYFPTGEFKWFKKDETGLM